MEDTIPKLAATVPDTDTPKKVVPRAVPVKLPPNELANK